jgi:uncharacterized membrane protein
MSVYGIVLFVVGVLFVLMGAGLIFYSSLTKRREAGAKGQSGIEDGTLKIIFDFVLNVLKFLAGLFPGEKTAQGGLALIVVGIALIVLAVILPGL